MSCSREVRSTRTDSNSSSSSHVKHFNVSQWFCFAQHSDSPPYLIGMFTWCWLLSFGLFVPAATLGHQPTKTSVFIFGDLSSSLHFLELQSARSFTSPYFTLSPGLPWRCDRVSGMVRIPSPTVSPKPRICWMLLAVTPMLKVLSHFFVLVAGGPKFYTHVGRFLHPSNRKAFGRPTWTSATPLVVW